jgi:RNA polymerase sigma-70 factor (ECF subfamily)
MPGGAGAPSEPPAVPDDAVVEAVRRGDHRIAHVIYERLRPVIDQTLYRILGHRGGDHDDLVQKAFEQVVITLSRHSFAHMCSLRTWAARIATNVGLNALRSRRRERTVIDWSRDPETPVAGEGSRDPSAMLDSRAQLQHVRLLLGEMNASQVEVLLLHDVVGHDLSEIALMLGVSMPAAQSRLFRGRRELRQRLERAGLTGVAP